jgi:hypothetical protein
VQNKERSVENVYSQNENVRNSLIFVFMEEDYISILKLKQIRTDKNLIPVRFIQAFRVNKNLI